VKRKISHWENLYTDWLSFGSRVHVIHYEDVKDALVPIL
jgi:hypothetical protein